VDISLSIERNIFEKMCQLGNIDHNNIQPNISIAFKKEENKKCGADFKEFFENNKIPIPRDSGKTSRCVYKFVVENQVDNVKISYRTRFSKELQDAYQKGTPIK
jgi:hypothetical protein